MCRWEEGRCRKAERHRLEAHLVIATVDGGWPRRAARARTGAAGRSRNAADTFRLLEFSVAPPGVLLMSSIADISPPLTAPADSGRFGSLSDITIIDLT